jgi:hypothetical protein
MYVFPYLLSVLSSLEIFLSAFATAHCLRKRFSGLSNEILNVFNTQMYLFWEKKQIYVSIPLLQTLTNYPDYIFQKNVRTHPVPGLNKFFAKIFFGFFCSKPKTTIITIVLTALIYTMAKYVYVDMDSKNKDRDPYLQHWRFYKL